MSREITLKEAVEKLKQYVKDVQNSIAKRNHEVYKELNDLIPREINPVKEIILFCPECKQSMHLLEGITHVGSAKNEYLIKFICRTKDCELFEKPLRIIFII